MPRSLPTGVVPRGCAGSAPRARMPQTGRKRELCSFASGRAALGSRSCRRGRGARCGGGHQIAFVPITTAGDRDRKSPFGQIGERGVFVKEIEEALLAGRIDVAVHSAKDMTSTDTDGPRGRRVPRTRRPARRAGRRRRDPARHADRHGVRPPAARSCSRYEPTVSVEPLRGNVDTRLRKARERGLDALVLASCGLDRLGLGAEIGLRIPVEMMLPEAAQGALALQMRAGEEELVAHADDAETRRRVEAERACVAGSAPAASRRSRRITTARSYRADRRRGRVVGRARDGDDPAAVAAALIELGRGAA